MSAVLSRLVLVDSSLPARMVEDAFRGGPEGLLLTGCQGRLSLARSPGGRGSSGWAGDQAAKGLARMKPVLGGRELSHCWSWVCRCGVPFVLACMLLSKLRGWLRGGQVGSQSLL